MMPDFEGEKIHVSNKPFRLFLYQFVIWGIKPLQDLQGSRKLFTNHYDKNG